ncbi:type I 3-dehydroquinate dehydratase [Venenivibrio stagnispumantis]|uniref:3-dehydroquinate dehydratase n=1 Tax=Venenivibrio stagnispumantis TaxID=407998 RepID=A0AA45WIB1_9AQUI|nr:type I 3-dehydroquinate dehydratase [Venenivibrio stagnispumantis]MCW4572759.1 type I 3-dehydroquinate dehydratase [Venenivibrio stagnispumantis]SMP00302.1 3-dehydroquinate dehydratase [Venenivibrio stagnispumantis]
MFEQKPLIAIPLNDENIYKNIDIAKEKGADIIELRIDQFNKINIEEIINILKYIKAKDLKSISTIRSEKEGGKFIQNRYEIFKEIVKYTDIIDIELTSFDIREKVIKLAKENGKYALISYHDFEKTPDNIQQIINQAYNLGADIIKFAFKANSFEDVAKILCITNQNKDKNIVAIAMGDYGKISRLAGFVFGSLITYSFLGEAFASGQIQIDKLIEDMKFYNLR